MKDTLFNEVPFTKFKYIVKLYCIIQFIVLIFICDQWNGCPTSFSGEWVRLVDLGVSPHHQREEKRMQNITLGNISDALQIVSFVIVFCGYIKAMNAWWHKRSK